MEEIYCPKCGTTSSGDRRFCRSCGLDLQALNQFLTGKPGVSEGGEAHVDYISRKRKLKRQGGWMAWWGWVVSAVLSITGAAINSIGSETPIGQFFTILSAIGGPFIITGLAMLLYATFILKGPAPPRSLTAESTPTNQLGGNMFSVTEGTTELFEGERIELPRRDTAPQSQ